MNKIEILAQELTLPQYADLVTKQDYPAIAQQLNNKPLIPSPAPQTNIPKPLTILELYQSITPQEGLEIYKIPNLKPDIDHAITSNNRDNLTALLAIASSVLSPESVAKIQALMAQEIPDPFYQSQVPGLSRAEELGISPVTEHEVQAVLNPITESVEDSE